MGTAYGHASGGAFDKMIAATAMVHGLTVATRNYKDFADTGVRWMDPFE